MNEEFSSSPNMIVQYNARCARRSYVAVLSHPQLPRLADGATIETFRRDAFEPNTPILFPKSHFSDLPAISKWFTSFHDTSTLNIRYFTPLAASTLGAPLEFTPSRSTRAAYRVDGFARRELPLKVFLAYIAKRQQRRTRRWMWRYNIYLGQCPLSLLDSKLQADLPTPRLVSETGRGDIYDTSIWMGQAPTYTPLHKDPNPNLFVQIAGKKRLRIMEPAMGAELYQEMKKRLGLHGAEGIRGEEMMQGEEKKFLHEVVWGAESMEMSGNVKHYEATLSAGDGIFIPKGWWHSIKGIGTDFTGSVSISMTIFD